MAFLRKHAFILDTAQGTIDFPEDPNHDDTQGRDAKMQPKTNYQLNRKQAHNFCTVHLYHTRVNTREYLSPNNRNNTVRTTV